MRINRRTQPRRTPRPRRAGWYAVGVLLGLVLGVPQSRAQSEALQQAVAVYQSADFAGAISLLTAVLDDETADKATRKQALQYLGRAYVAQRMEDKARAVIQELLELEPPLVELNPEIEPPPLINLYYEVRRDFEGSYEVERDETERAGPGLTTLAVVDFTNNSISDDRERLDALQQGFPSLIINQLSGATDLKVIERERIQWLLQELELQRDPRLVDPSTAVRAGKLLGATAVLFGSFIKHGRDMSISARLVKVETGEILLAEQVRGRADKFYELAEELSGKVARSINARLDEAKLSSGTDTRSLDAMLSYSEGLALIERSDYRGAFAKFMEALEHDPGYERARRKAESLKPLLG